MGKTYHVAGLGGGAGKDEDHLGAAGGAAGLEVVAGRRELAGLDHGGLVLNLDGGSGESGDEAGGSEEREELHFGGLVVEGRRGLFGRRVLLAELESRLGLEA